MLIKPSDSGLIKEWNSGNLFIRRMPHRLDKAGDTIDGHSHGWPHTSLVLLGGARFEGILQNGRDFSFDKYAACRDFRDTRCHLLIHAKVIHKITALVDDTIVWCIYSHRNPQGDIIQVFDGWEPAYG